jgi:LytR cell envelope-related transcriptional attenuator
LPEIIQDIGAYAGLASVLGLAVLSALYFSQARDVKRLREWAGRAPERAEQAIPAVPGRVVAQPQQKQDAARPSAPAVPGRAPAVPGQAPAVPGRAPAVPGQAAVATGARPAAATPAGAKPAAAPAPAGQAAAAGAPPAQAADNSGAATEAPAKPAVPAPAGGNAGSRPPAPPVPRPTGPSRPAPQPTAIIPPPRAERWYRRLAANPLYVVLAIAGVLIVGGAAAFGVDQLVNDDEGGGGGGQGQQQVSGGGDGGGGDQGRQRERRRGDAVNPANITVAVLNGTTVPGLAATLMDQVEESGFQGGTVANFVPNQQLAESVVQYTAGHEREAAAVGRRLGITQREAVNPSSQELAGDATVVVLAGADKAP